MPRVAASGYGTKLAELVVMATQNHVRQRHEPKKSSHPEVKPSHAGKGVPGSEMSKSKEGVSDPRNGNDKDGNEENAKHAGPR